MFKQRCRKEPNDVISSEFIEGEFSPRYLARFILFWLALRFVQFCNARQPAVSAKSDLKAFEQMVPARQSEVFVPGSMGCVNQRRIIVRKVEFGAKKQTQRRI